MTQDANHGFEEFRFLQRWARLLAHAESTLVAETGEGCLGLEKLLHNDGRTLRAAFHEQHECAMGAFRERARALASTLLPSAKASDEKSKEDPIKGIIERGTALDVIERLREMFALAHLPTTAELRALPDDPPWEDA